MQAPVLVLNATFEPINVTAVRRALVLMLKGVAQAEDGVRGASPEVRARNGEAGKRTASAMGRRCFPMKSVSGADEISFRGCGCE